MRIIIALLRGISFADKLWLLTINPEFLSWIKPISWPMLLARVLQHF